MSESPMRQLMIRRGAIDTPYYRHDLVQVWEGIQLCGDKMIISRSLVKLRILKVQNTGLIYEEI